jgi:outer membrane receptor protein involved in Fe transport
MLTLTLRSRLRATAASTILATAMFAVPSHAQDAAAEDEAGLTDIIVTGTRIVAPNLESANPVAVVTGEEIFQTGNTSVGDQLNDLPQLRNTYSQANGTRNLGNRGLNLLDLRGLGTQRTLVLVNGRRHVGSDVLINGVSVDVNTIPSDLIERIDVVTGGASAVYGSDAVAGVVNFILKDNYEGIGLRGQAGISKYGDLGKQFVSLVAGQNFAEDRGNIAISLEYAHNSPGYASGRPALRNNRAFVITDTDPAGTANGSDGVFDRTFYNDIRSSTIALGGMVAVAQTVANPACGLNVSAFTCTYQFQADGSLIPQTGTRIGIGPNGSFLGGNGYKGREGKLIILAPDLTRYSVNAIGHFEISPALVPFFEAKYVKTEAFGSQSGPFFSQGTTLGDPGNRERIRLDNPYLSTQARAQLTTALLATNANPNAGNNTALSAAALATQQAAINSGSFRFNLRRNWLDLGIRDEQIDRETYRIVGGIRGDFNDDWKYELSVNYGQHKETNIIKGNVNVQRYLLAVDSTRDASGNIVCRSKLDASNTVSYLTGGTLADGDDPRLAADIAACTPINPFGQGSVTQAARDYILVDSKARGKITQLDILGFVSGDTSGFFNLPGGPVSFSVGGEYRKETLFYDLDDLTQEGYAFYNAIPSFTSPSFQVKEAFGEINLPILRDTPFFQELTLRANGRIADYKGATGTVYAYGGEAVWKPIEDVTVRGTYARSVRAPNPSELYSAPGQNFAPGFIDPCSARNLATGSATRATNCTAAGAPAGYDFVYNQSLEIVSGGNPDLREETSDSWTAGILLQPRFLPGFSISADYYDITVKGAIDSVDAQDIANLCYDAASLNNQYCGLFERAGASGGPAGEVPFQILEASLLQSSLNYAKLKVRGVDVNLDYTHAFDFGKLKLSAVWTHVFQTDQFNDPTDPAFKDRFLDELNDPSDAVNLNASLQVGKVTFGYQMRWLDKMYLNTYEDYNSLNGLPPQNADYAPVVKYPDVFYHDFRLGVEVNDKFDFYFGVDNAFNKFPPYGLTGVGAGSGIYDNVGRYFYTGFQAKF